MRIYIDYLFTINVFSYNILQIYHRLTPNDFIVLLNHYYLPCL